MQPLYGRMLVLGRSERMPSSAAKGAMRSALPPHREVGDRLWTQKKGPILPNELRPAKAPRRPLPLGACPRAKRREGGAQRRVRAPNELRPLPRQEEQTVMARGEGGGPKTAGGQAR